MPQRTLWYPHLCRLLVDIELLGHIAELLSRKIVLIYTLTSNVRVMGAGTHSMASGPNLVLARFCKECFIGAQLLFCIICGCFCLLRAELSICNRTTWPTEPKLFTKWPFADKVCRLLLISLEKFCYLLGVLAHFTKVWQDDFDVECGSNIKHLIPKPLGFKAVQIRLSIHHLMAL